MAQFFLLFCLLLINLSYAGSAPTPINSPTAVTQDTEKLTITADELDYIPASNISNAKGHARAEKGEGNERQILTADEFIVHFKEQPKDGKPESKTNNSSSGQDIETIDAKDNVIMVKGDLVMTAEKCVYSSEMAKDPKKADQIDCQGNVSVTKGGHLIKGDEGTVNLKTGIYTVKKSPFSKRKRVEAFIQTQSSDKKVRT